MSDKPQIKLGTGDDTFDGEHIDEHSQRDKVPFSTVIRPGLYERLRAASFWEGTSIAELTGQAVASYLKVMEDQRGKPYEVLPPHRITNS